MSVGNKTLSKKKFDGPIHLMRCIGPSNFFLERVLFPTDILTFMAPNDSRVEIWGNELYGPKLEERIRISADNEDSTLVA